MDVRSLDFSDDEVYSVMDDDSWWSRIDESSLSFRILAIRSDLNGMEWIVHLEKQFKESFSKCSLFVFTFPWRNAK